MQGWCSAPTYNNAKTRTVDSLISFTIPITEVDGLCWESEPEVRVHCLFRRRK